MCPCSRVSHTSAVVHAKKTGRGRSRGNGGFVPHGRVRGHSRFGPRGWGQGAASLGGRDGPCGPLTAPSLDLKCAHLFSNENGKGGKEHGAVAAAVTGWRARTYSRPRSRESSQVTPEVPSAWNVPEPVSSLLLGHPRARPGSPGGEGGAFCRAGDSGDLRYLP